MKIWKWEQWWVAKVGDVHVFNDSFKGVLVDAFKCAAVQKEEAHER